MENEVVALRNLTRAQLRRKAEAEWALAAAARREMDHFEELVHTASARKYEAALREKR